MNLRFFALATLAFAFVAPIHAADNTLTADDGRVIAEVVEILPPHRV